MNTKQNNTGKKIILAVAVLLAAMVLLVAVTKYLERTEARQNAPEETTSADVLETEKTTVTLYDTEYVCDHEIESYLFLGTDDSGNEDAASSEEYEGSMADFIGVIVLDKTEETRALLQLNRDTMTEVRMLLRDGTGDAWQELQLCTAHWYGGNVEQSCENTVEVVSKMLGGIPISGYYSLPMEEIGTLNHAVGGVTVTVQDDFSQVDESLVEGEEILLSDEQAETYVRSRMDVGDGENISRMERQKQYLDAFSEKAASLIRSDASFANDLYGQLSDAAQTSLNGNEVSKLLNKAVTYTNKGIYTFTGTTEIGQALGDGLDHTEFYPEEDSVTAVMTELYSLTPRSEE